MVTTIENSGVPQTQKQQLYATIMNDLPPAPRLLGIDFSGSFAAQQPDDHCVSDGQRPVCRALKEQSTDLADRTAICGFCDPQ